MSAEPPPRPSERRPELPHALDAVVARGLANVCRTRYRSATALVEDARRERLRVARPPSRRRERRRQGPLRRDDHRSSCPRSRSGRRGCAGTPGSRGGHPPSPPALVLAGLAGRGLPRSVGSRATARTSSVAWPRPGPLLGLVPRTERGRRPHRPPIPGLGLEDAVALRSDRRRWPGRLVVRLRSQREGSPLLPPELATGSCEASPAADTVRVGRAQGLLYRALPADARPLPPRPPARPDAAGSGGRRLPDAPRASLRRASRPTAARSRRRCGCTACKRCLSAGTWSLHRTHSRPELARLDGERLARRRQLARRGDAVPSSARAAAGLAAAYAATAPGSAADRADPPFARPSHQALYGAAPSGANAARLSPSPALARVTSRATPAQLTGSKRPRRTSGRGSPASCECASPDLSFPGRPAGRHAYDARGGPASRAFICPIDAAQLRQGPPYKGLILPRFVASVTTAASARACLRESTTSGKASSGLLDRTNERQVPSHPRC